MIDVPLKPAVQPWARIRRVAASTAAVALAIGGVSVVTPAAQAANGKTLLNADGQLHVEAYGDSYTSGHGASTTYTSVGCKVSDASYSKVVATQLSAILKAKPDDGTGEPNFVNRACTGGRIIDVLGNQLTSVDVPPDVETDLVILTIGGNDVHFADVARRCVIEVSSVCTAALNDAEPQINTLEKPLRNLLVLLRKKKPNANIVVSGYPLIFATGACGILGISEDNRDHVRTLQTRFNKLIKGAVDHPSVQTGTGAVKTLYADANPLFTNHRICDDDPWINSVTDGLVTFDPGAAYHPTETGHKAMAQVVIDTLLDAETGF